MIKKRVPGFPDYWITEDSRVWSDKSAKFLSAAPDCVGYPKVVLVRGSDHVSKRVHRLVLETFVGSCPEGMETCHNNGVRTDNRLCNLRWDTRSNNSRDSVKHGTHVGCRKLADATVRLIRRLAEQKVPQKQIAALFNISPSHVSNLHCNRVRKI